MVELAMCVHPVAHEELVETFTVRGLQMDFRHGLFLFGSYPEVSLSRAVGIG